MTRREALKGGVRAISLALAGAFVWSVATKEAKARVFIKPPGATKDFASKCIKCSLCVEACPYDTLKLATLGDETTIGTPYFEPRLVPCEMCDDIPCTVACPSGALDIKLVSDKNSKLDPRSIRMGIAVLDIQSCIAHYGIRCDACYRACPLIDQALKLEYKRNERTNKHAYLLPIVDANFCTGCGKCERACVTEKAAIFVLPYELGMGAMGDNYVISWEDGSDAKLDKASSEINLDDSKPLDYLNDGGLL